MNLKFYVGEENGVIVEKANYTESLFTKQYCQALSIFSYINDILSRSSQCDDENSMEFDMSNIMAFCGDRGEGKTSCMKSVVEILRNIQSEKVADVLKLAGIFDKDSIRTGGLLILDSIDPALFDSKHNVLEIVLGLLYSVFTKIDESSLKQEEKDLYSKVIMGFREVRKRLHHLMDEIPQMYDMLDEMDILAASIELRKEIAKLFKNLTILRNCSKIVIVVDDMDLNMNRAYTMAEQVRTFLNNPYCVVMMSCRVEQLQLVIATSLKEQMGGRNIDSDEINLMAVKYVTKFLPVGNRINMPKVYDIASVKVDIFKDRSQADCIAAGPVKMLLLELIFKKTRYLFYNSQGSLSPIIPNNLRSLRHLLGMLLAMHDFESNKKNLENKRIFKHYFYYTWTRNLDAKHQDFINRIVTSQNLISINKEVLVYLSQQISEEKRVGDSIMKNILNSTNYVYNISLGDVFYVLQYIEQSATDVQMQQLLFFLRSYYSISLYENYDILTEGLETEEKQDEKAAIYKTDALFDEMSQLQRVLNGSYFTYRPDDLLPPSNEYGSRDYKLIDGVKLHEYAEEVEHRIEMYENGRLQELDTDFMDKFRLLEFFALTLTHSVPSKSQSSYMNKDRTKLIPHYLEKFDAQSKYFVFDVMAVFSNIHNVRMAYNRFAVIEHDVLYKFAKKQSWSLLNQMIESVRRKECMEKGCDFVSVNLAEDETVMNRLLSNATIRNGEVLAAVFNQIKSRRYDYRRYKDSADILALFYKNLVMSKMRTYDRTFEDAYEMRFAFLEAIITFLRTTPTTLFREIYEYTPPKVVTRNRRRGINLLEDEEQENMK